MIVVSDIKFEVMVFIEVSFFINVTETSTRLVFSIAIPLKKTIKTATISQKLEAIDTNSENILLILLRVWER
jgi:hypothetical protein